MEIEYIIIYKGCDEKKTPFKIDLETKIIDYWPENRIKSMTFGPENINLVLVGPRTIFEYYESPHFTGQKNRVINASSDKIKLLRVGCLEDHSVFRGKIRSFIIWSYDYYESVYGIRYCKDNSDCRSTEFCMCKNGETNPGWCPVSKQRCMAKGYFYHDGPVPVFDRDLINNKNLAEELIKKNEIIKFGDIREAASKELIDKVEGFYYHVEKAKYPLTPIAIVITLLIFIPIFILRYRKIIRKY